MKKLNKEEKKILTKNTCKSRKKFFLTIILLIIVFVVVGFSLYLFLNKEIVVQNVEVKNSNFHEIEISWDKLEKNSDYVVLISNDEFKKEDIEEDLKDGNFDFNYQVIEMQNEEILKYNLVMSDNDYYISVLAFKNSGNKRKYYEPSEIIKIHTDALKLDSITDLIVEDITDTSAKLKWSFDNFEKNLDGTSIDITYTLFLVNDSESIELKKDITTTNYSISDLKPFSKYSYKIIANAVVDGKVVTSEDSNILEVITKPAVVSPSSESSGTNAIILTWNEYDKSTMFDTSASITYSVYASDSENGEYKLLKDHITETTYTESGLDQNKTRYYYVVTNIEINGEKYLSNNSQIVHATTEKKVVVTPPTSNTTKPPTNNGTFNNNTSSNNQGSNSSSKELTSSQKEAQAREIARKIAKSITGSTDLEKVSKAAQAVSAYYYRGVHKETGNDYYTAYGVFIKGESSCAGTTRALGMVLEEMGYSWKHANENLWTHQWVIITMDGKVGFADGQVGWAGYGPHPVEQQ